MARNVLTATTASPVSPIYQAIRPSNADAWLGTIGLTGAFGGATAQLEMSFDRGANWMAAQNMSGTAITATANANFNMTLGSGNSQSDAIQLRLNLTTPGTGASVNMIIFDNRS
jgi:hypothetical protein